MVPNTRICANMGGDDITRFLHGLLKHAGIPYADTRLELRYSDWALIEGLKDKYATMDEVCTFGLPFVGMFHSPQHFLVSVCVCVFVCVGRPQLDSISLIFLFGGHGEPQSSTK